MTLDREAGWSSASRARDRTPARISRVDPRPARPRPWSTAGAACRSTRPTTWSSARDGTIWFTDPSYGHLQGFRPAAAARRPRLPLRPAHRTAAVVADAFDKPNGLAFSPDERVLYVTDSGANQEPGSFHPTPAPHRGLRRRRRPRPRRRAAVRRHQPGFPDGIKVDSEGRVYASAFAGVQVFDPDGELIGEIALPGAVNFTFGGAGGDVLFITTDTAVWAAVLRPTQGAPEPHDRPSAHAAIIDTPAPRR